MFWCSADVKTVKTLKQVVTVVNTIQTEVNKHHICEMLKDIWDVQIDT